MGKAMRPIPEEDVAVIAGEKARSARLTRKEPPNPKTRSGSERSLAVLSIILNNFCRKGNVYIILFEYKR
jgi:hypothetical protein